MSVRFSGYAAIFDHVDRGGDIVERGAFRRTLGARRLPLLWQHRADRVAGVITLAAEDARGLRVIAEVHDPDVAALLVARQVSGLSFGYRVVDSNGSRPRRLLALDLIEVSLVAIPMQPLAQIVAIDRRTPFRT